jgi:hypothetical protein
MRRLLITIVVALALPAAALAGSTYTLHPSGFGEHSYSSWKAGEGLADSHGSADQALYLQKMTSTETFAAGVAVIKGFEGQPVSALTGLEFRVGLDGHCGAGAPRFNIYYQPAIGPRQTYFVGCQAMVPSDPVAAPSGRVFERRTYAGPFPDLGTITGIAIVFDEGNDVGQGFVHLDNITVSSQGGSHTWTSASDNGNGETITAAPTGAPYLSALLGFPLSIS